MSWNENCQIVSHLYLHYSLQPPTPYSCKDWTLVIWTYYTFLFKNHLYTTITCCHLCFSTLESQIVVPQNMHGLIRLGLQCWWHGHVHCVYMIIVTPSLIVKPLQVFIQIGKGGKGANTSFNTKSINEMPLKTIKSSHW